MARPTRVHGGRGSGPDGADAEEAPAADLRMPVLGAAAWAGALVGLLLTGWVAPVAVVALLVALGAGARLLARRGAEQVTRTALAAGLLLAAAAGIATVHRVGTATGPVSALAEERASVRGSCSSRATRASAAVRSPTTSSCAVV
ncbi:hypothetical protein [Nocardioides zeae]